VIDNEVGILRESDRNDYVGKFPSLAVTASDGSDSWIGVNHDVETTLNK
jgi:hypothetical protein